MGRRGMRTNLRERSWAIGRTLDDIRETFDPHRVCSVPYQTFLELVDQDLRCSTKKPMLEEVEQPGIGTYLMPCSPLEFSKLERLAVRRAPRLGEHPNEALAEMLALSDAEIGRLQDEGAVAAPTPVAV